MNNKDKLQIIEEYNGLINKYVNMYFRSIKGNWISKDDLKQEIILGLLNDLDKLDESKGKSVFIEKSIENNCLSYIKTRNRIKRGNGLADDSLDKKIISDDENINLIDVKYEALSKTYLSDYDLEYDTINNILTKDILSFIENNNDRQALILKMYSEGYTFSDIGCMLNMSRQRANLIYRKAIYKIRNKFKIEVV